MATTELPATRTAQPAPIPLPQYSLTRTLGTWAAAALPMAAMAWLVTPRLAHRLDGPTALSRALILALTAGLIWQFVLVLILVHREQGSLRWPIVKDVLWLHAPRRPSTGRRGGRAWLIVIPLIFALAAEELLPTLPTPVTRDMSLFLGSRRADVPFGKLGLVRLPLRVGDSSGSVWDTVALSRPRSWDTTIARSLTSGGFPRRRGSRIQAYSC